MSARITIKDIAKALNVHHSTVSRALRNDKRVKEDTLKLVQDYARRNGYQTNFAARELRGEKRNMIAVVVPNINHLFFSNVVSCFTNYANNENYVVSVFQSNESYEQECQIVDTIIQNNFAGVIASISMESKVVSHFNKLKQFNIPLVMFDRVGDDIDVSKVLINNRDILEEVVSLLVKQGRRRIAYISGSSAMSVFGERQKGYEKALEKAALGYKRLIPLDGEFTIENGVLVANDLLGDAQPDAIICDSSNLTYGLVKEFKRVDVEMPQDLVIVAFGEHSIFSMIEPSIITVEQPTDEIAKSAFNLLFEQIEKPNEKHSVKSLLLSAGLIQ